MGIAQNASTDYYNTNSFQTYLTASCPTGTGATPVVRVISISYGMKESAAQNQMNSFDTLAQQCGLMGVTIVVSSGDDGASYVFLNFKI
jgi:subtilase family serine protease